MPDSIQAIYATDVISGFDLHKPERMNQLFRRYGNQGIGYFQTLRSMGFELESKNDTYSHYEENRIHETFHSNGAVVDPGAGNDAEITLSPDDLDGNNRFYPRLYDQVMFPNEVVGYIAEIDVTTPTAPVITVRPVDDTDNIGALDAGTELIIFSSAFSEGSGQPDSVVSGAWFYENDAQIIKETIEATGSEMTTQDWTEVMSDGTQIPAWYYKGQKDLDYRMSLKIDGALLFGKRNTNAAAIDPDTGRPIKSTEGVIPFVRRTGHEVFRNAGAFTIDDFDEIARILDQEHVGAYTLSMSGLNRAQNFDNILKTYFNDTNIQYAKEEAKSMYFGDVDALAASVNFKYLSKTERTYMFQTMPNFTNPKTFGAEGYGTPNMSLFLPLGKVKDPRSKDMGDNLGVRYRGLGAYNRRMEVWDVRGAGPGLKVTQFDKSSTYQRTHIGAHNRGGNQMVVLSE